MHWQAGDRALPEVAVTVAGESALWVDPAEIPSDGSHLERYARRFNAVEINSSFYRPHQRKTYERWARSTPQGFRFSVKVPKATVPPLSTCSMQSMRPL